MKKRDFDMIVPYIFDNCEIEILVHVIGFSQARPAPDCQNPSDPRYSDPGDDASYEDYKASILIRHDTNLFFIPLPDSIIEIIGEEINRRIFIIGEAYEKDYNITLE